MYLHNVLVVLFLNVVYTYLVSMALFPKTIHNQSVGHKRFPNENNIKVYSLYTPLGSRYTILLNINPSVY